MQIEGLEKYFQEVAPLGSLRIAKPPTPLKGGRDSDLFVIDLASTAKPSSPFRVVLKMYAPSAAGVRHGARESSALSCLPRVGVNTPKLLFFEECVDHLGAPFLIMEHLVGSSFWDAYRGARDVVQADLIGRFAGQLAKLHRLSPEVLTAGSIPIGTREYVEQELSDIFRDSQQLAVVDVDPVLEWLREGSAHVSPGVMAIQHRDYHPWNVLTDGGTGMWIIDWDWKVGDPRFDVAWACALAQRSSLMSFAASFREAYEVHHGGALPDFQYFEVLATMRWLLNVIASIQPGSSLSDSNRESFKEFLIDPLRRAAELLRGRTGKEVRF